MIEAQTQYIVKRPVLWFQAAGLTSPDTLDGFPQHFYTVYRSVIANPGDRFHFVGGHLVHQAQDGTNSFGVFRLHSGKDATTDFYDAIRMHSAGEVAAAASMSPSSLPPVPNLHFGTGHSGIERDAVSPAFVAMMDATEDFRHTCDDEGYWSVICSDYGQSRTVSLGVLDAETGCPILYVEHDPLSSSVTVSINDDDIRSRMVSALRDRGIEIEGDGTVSGWSAELWKTLGEYLSTAFDTTPAFAPPLAMTA